MPSALVVVQMETANGNRFSNVHAVKQLRGGVGTGQPDAGFIDDIFGTRLKNGDFSQVITPGSPIGSSAVEAILRWHMGLHSTHVTIKKVYVSDGKTPGPATGTYAVIDVNQTAHSAWHGAAPITDTNVDALNTALMVVKQPVLLNLRAGRMWLRAAVRSQDIDDGTPDGATLLPAAQARLRAVIERAEQDSGIAMFYDGEAGVNGQVYYGQAQFYSKAEVQANPTLKGALKVVQSIRGMQLADANSRQLKRGRKRAVTAQQLAAALRAQGLDDAADTILAREATKVPVDTGVFPTVYEGVYPVTDVDETNPEDDELDPANYSPDGTYNDPSGGI